MSDLGTVILITGIAGMATGLGAIPVFFQTSVSHRVYDGALGLAGGIMFAAAVFALILPGLETGTLLAVMSGVLLGGFTLLIFNQLLPHLHARYGGWSQHGSEDAINTDRFDRIRRAVLIGGAIVLHNAPEGLAIGIAFASGFEGVALALAIVIGLQNIPDGFAFAVPLGMTELSRSQILLYTTLSGLVPQVISAIIGFGLVFIVTGIFPIAAGFAAGAMIAVVFREMVPLSHGHGHADWATTAFLLGFALIVVVDTLLIV